MGMHEVEMLESPDRTRRLYFYARTDGFFHFKETVLVVEEIPGYGTETYWSPGWESGVYINLDDARREAKLMTPWLRASIEDDLN